METELCNMCMITDPEGRVLVQDRLEWANIPRRARGTGGDRSRLCDPGSARGNGPHDNRRCSCRIYSVVQSRSPVAIFCFPV